MQTKTHSIIESCTNVAIGYVVAVASQVIIFPVFDVSVSMGEHCLIGLYFTVVSLLRSYALRRWFTNKTENSA